MTHVGLIALTMLFAGGTVDENGKGWLAWCHFLLLDA